MKDKSVDTFYLGFEAESFIREEAERRKQTASSTPAGRSSYLFQMGRIPVNVNQIEYRILSFLSARPYHAYTPVEIVEAVNVERDLISSETLSDHIASLRDKLGVFRDYIQSVPYIGYRFKA